MDKKLRTIPDKNKSTFIEKWTLLDRRIAKKKSNPPRSLVGNDK